MPRPDHPWLAEFEAAPDRAFDALIRGVSVPFPYNRAEPREVVATLFGALSDRDPLRDVLDRVLGDWLARRRQDPPAWRAEYGMDRYVQELVDALHLVYRLDLRSTAGRLAGDYFAWLGWVRGLVMNSARDPLKEFWNVLAQTQTDGRFVSRWFGLCKEAGVSLPHGYVNVGLLGIRRLPPSGTDPLDQALSGLAIWGAHLGERDKPRFQRQWRALRALYPHGSGFWRDHVTPLLKGRTEPFAEWWRADLKAGKGGTAKPVAGAIQVPPKERLEAIKARIGNEPLEWVRPDVERLIADQLRYAEATGVARFVVYTACYIGKRVLSDAPDLAHDLARIAVRWEPRNPFGWTLWGHALMALGRGDLAEVVLWETTRRFPNNASSRNTLAGLLAQTGRPEAEALYRDTIRRFPNDESSHTALAEFLVRTGREFEAEALYGDMIGAFPRNGMGEFSDSAVCRSALCCLLIHQKRYDEVKAQLPELAQLDVVAAQRILDALDRAHKGDDESRKKNEAPIRDLEPRGAGDADVMLLRDDGDVVCAGFRLGPALDVLAEVDRERLRAEAVANLDAIRAHRPDHAGAVLVAVAWEQAGERDRAARWAPLMQAFPGNYGLRLDIARRLRDADALADLLDDFPTRAALTRLARLRTRVAELDDAAKLASWLGASTEETVKADPVLAFLWHTLDNWIGAAKASPDAVATLAGWGDDAVDALLADAAFAAVQDDAPLLAA